MCLTLRWGRGREGRREREGGEERKVLTHVCAEFTNTRRGEKVCECSCDYSRNFSVGVQLFCRCAIFQNKKLGKNLRVPGSHPVCA